MALPYKSRTMDIRKRDTSFNTYMGTQEMTDYKIVPLYARSNSLPKRLVKTSLALNCRLRATIFRCFSACLSSYS